MNKPILSEKPSFEEALARDPKTLHEARALLGVIREKISKQPQSASGALKKGDDTPASSQDRPFSDILAENERTLAEIRSLIEAETGEKIILTNGKNVVIRAGKQIEVAALEETKAWKQLEAAMKAAADGRERFRIAAAMAEMRRTYGTGRK